MEKATIQQSAGLAEEQPKKGKRNRRTSAAVNEYYAQAAELYRTTDLAVREIAIQCGLHEANLASYLAHWQREAMRERKEKRQQRRTTGKTGVDKSARGAKTTNQYLHAIPLIKKGLTYHEVALRLNISVKRITGWVRRHHPDIHVMACGNQWVALTGGGRMTRDLWLRFQEAVEVFNTTDEPLWSIARRLHLSLKTLTFFLPVNFPEAHERRMEAAKNKRAGKVKIQVNPRNLMNADSQMLRNKQDLY